MQYLQNAKLKKGGQPMSEIKMAFTVDEAAAYTGLGRNTIRQLISWKKIPVLHIGRKIIIRRDTLEEFITQCFSSRTTTSQML